MIKPCSNCFLVGPCEEESVSVDRRFRVDESRGVIAREEVKLELSGDDLSRVFGPVLESRLRGESGAVVDVWLVMDVMEFSVMVGKVRAGFWRREFAR